MLTFVRSQLWHRRNRSFTLAAGIVVASVSFVLLVSAAKTSSLRVHGVLQKNYRTAYDILVRPKSATSSIERQRGLVRDNFLSGIFGGISEKQYRTISNLPGVAVAAPIANLGYVLLPETIPVSLQPFLTKAPAQLFRVRFTYVAQNGLSHYPAGSQYVYYTPNGRFVSSPQLGQLVAGQREPLPVCYGFGATAPPPTSPFDERAYSVLDCYSGVSRARSGFPDVVGTGLNAYFPIMLSAIDPVAEAKLVGLRQTVVSGRYLRESDKPSIATISGLQGSRSGLEFVPVIASSKTFLDEKLVASVERLSVPADIDVPRMLSAGACAIPFVPCPARDLFQPPPHASASSAYDFVSHLHGRVVGQTTVAAQSLYRTLLHGRFQHGRLDFDSYWSVSSVQYTRSPSGDLRPVAVSNDADAVWTDRLAYGGYYQAPPDNRDNQFRRLHAHVGNNSFSGQRQSVLQTPRLRVVGTYDPQRIAGFSPLSHVPLETYQPPTLDAGDPITRRRLGGQPLRPDQNLGDYIAQPPLLLTTLSSVQAFLAQTHFTNVSRSQRDAPISTIRVRVAGVNGLDALSEARIRSVAQLIHDHTGLSVDITAGSSPHTLLVTLPAGRNGRPALVLRENWSKKGVALVFFRAVDRKDVALFLLILVICTLFLTNGTIASTRARRTEIGALMTVGWTSAAIVGAILSEVAVIGLVAGTAGTAIAVGVIELGGEPLPLLATAAVIPVALLLALVAGAAAASQALRLTPVEALTPPVSSGGSRRLVGSRLALAIVNLIRVPSRSALGCAGLAITAAALTLLVAIQVHFQGTLVGTLLGRAISVQVRHTDFVAIGLTLVLTTASVADVLYINLRERAAELATLRASGWSEADLASVVILEGLGLGVAGGTVGAVLGATLGAGFLVVPPPALLEGVGVAFAAAVGSALAGSAVPLLTIRALRTPAVLADEI